jgi:hypothetical protein
LVERNHRVAIAMEVIDGDMGSRQRLEAFARIMLGQSAIELFFGHTVGCAGLLDSRITGQITHRIDPGYAGHG